MSTSYAHTMVKPPDPIRTPKLSTIGPAQYCGGGPRGNRRWCTFCHNKCSCGPMAKACDYESRDWGFESLQGCFYLYISKGQWSSGMILASGARGRGFDSPLAPFLSKAVASVAQLVERSAVNR